MIQLLPPQEDEFDNARHSALPQEEFDPLPPPTPEDGVRILTSNEIKTLIPLFEERGAELPEWGVVVGSVRDGEVVGFIILQYKLFAEPMWIKPGHSEEFFPIINKAEETILSTSGPQWVYTSTTLEKVTDIALGMGMEQLPEKLFCKLVVPKPPKPPGRGLTGVINELRTTEHSQDGQ